MNIILVLICTLVMYLSFNVINYINVKDNASIKTSIIFKTFYSILYGLVAFTIYHKFRFTLVTGVYSLTALFLMLCAYIDYKTLYVYSFLTIPMLCVSLVFAFYVMIKYNMGYYNIIMITLTVAVVSLLAYYNKLGWGDVEVYIIICFVLGGTMGMIAVILSHAISVVSWIKHIIRRDLSLKTQNALVPYIAVSYIILLLSY